MRKYIVAFLILFIYCQTAICGGFGLPDMSSIGKIDVGGVSKRDLSAMKGMKIDLKSSRARPVYECYCPAYKTIQLGDRDKVCTTGQKLFKKPENTYHLVKKFEHCGDRKYTYVSYEYKINGGQDTCRTDFKNGDTPKEMLCVD